MSATTATRQAKRLFYILDLEACVFGRDPKILFVGTQAEALAQRDGDFRYEIYDSLKEYNAAIRYYNTIL